uniref:Uncharacterized protein n=1 Tax=Arundo donax TaxID=35708 RepID=A0A0A8ZLG3_ARUDO
MRLHSACKQGDKAWPWRERMVGWSKLQ